MSRRPYFEGLYFKHQKGDQMLALIPGRADDGAFIQVLTPERSYHIPFAAGQVSGQHAVIGENSFSCQGINPAHRYRCIMPDRLFKLSGPAPPAQRYYGSLSLFAHGVPPSGGQYGS